MTDEQWEAVKKWQLQAFYRVWDSKTPADPQEAPKPPKNTHY